MKYSNKVPYSKLTSNNYYVAGLIDSDGAYIALQGGGNALLKMNSQGALLLQVFHPEGYWEDIVNSSNPPQGKTDGSLNTTAKTIVGGINELLSLLNNLSKVVVTVLNPNSSFTAPRTIGGFMCGWYHSAEAIIPVFGSANFPATVFARDGVTTLGTVVSSGNTITNNTGLYLVTFIVY